MFFGIILSIWLTSTTVVVDDSAFVLMQQTNAPEYDTIAAIFTTLDAAFKAETNIRQTVGAYPTFSVLSDEDEHPSPARFQQLLNCRLPKSLITADYFKITVGIRPAADCPDTSGFTANDYLLVIAFFNPADSANLPIARLCYCSACKKIYHEYIYQKLN